MKITMLMEDKEVDRAGLKTEHGLSVYIEVDGKKILFDTGQSGKFIDNAKALGIDLKGLDHVFISHGHYDHSGGLKRLIEEVKPNIEVYVGKGFFDDKYSLRTSGDYQYTGNPFDQAYLKEKNIEVKYVDRDMIQITENFMVFTNFNRKNEFENTNQKMFLRENGGYKLDPFTDEISLGIKTDKGLVVVVGCSHPGIVNILDTIIDRSGMNIHQVLGGTHLVEEDDEKINKIIDYLKEKDIDLVGACHCTGKQGETMLEQQLEEGFTEIKTGDTIRG